MPDPAVGLEMMINHAQVEINDARETIHLNWESREPAKGAMSVTSGLAATGAVDEMFSALADWMSPALRIPLVGPWMKGILKSFRTKARTHAAKQYAKGDHAAAVGTQGLKGSTRATQWFAPIVLAYVHRALHDLWHHALGPRIHHAITHTDSGTGRLRAAIRQIGEQIQHIRIRVKELEHLRETKTPKVVKTYVQTYVKGATIPEARDSATLRDTVKKDVQPQTADQIGHADVKTGQQIGAELGLGLAATAGTAAALLNFAQKTGLDTASCRAKNKGICATDKNLWANMLAGLVGIAALLSLEELEQIALGVAEVAEPVVQEVAKIST